MEHNAPAPVIIMNLRQAYPAKTTASIIQTASENNLVSWMSNAQMQAIQNYARDFAALKETMYKYPTLQGLSFPIKGLEASMEKADLPSLKGAKDAIKSMIDGFSHPNTVTEQQQAVEKLKALGKHFEKVN